MLAFKQIACQPWLRSPARGEGLEASGDTAFLNVKQQTEAKMDPRMRRDDE